jgi:hypothetical protein
MFQITPEPKQTIDWLTFILDLIKILAPIATLIISIINLRYALWMFNYKNSREDEDKNRNRNIDWFKKLILDPNLPYFYEFFENIELECKKLSAEGCSDQDKIDVELATLQHQIQLRRKFMSNLSVVDESLYDFVEGKIDELVGEMNKAIFDQGIKLSHNPMFQEKILKPLSETKTEILKKMFEYKGEQSNKLLKS